MRSIFTYSIALFVTLVCGTADADSMIRKEHFEDFKTIITFQGYVCRTCDGGQFLGEKERGKVFRVYCNDNTLKYRVTIAPSGVSFVRPWDE